MNAVPCIWCGRKPAQSLEHIIPDSLGCPPDWILSEGVCSECNQKNGKLDRALLVPFEFQTVARGTPRKGGKKPTIDGWASISSTNDENGPVIFLNREKYSVQPPFGRRLAGTNALDPVKRVNTVIRPDRSATVTIEIDRRFDRKATRGLFKIAVEAIALMEGLEVIFSQEFKEIKNFVREGKGQFRALMMRDQSAKQEYMFHPCGRLVGSTRLFGMSFLGCSFWCDFDASFTGGKMLLEETKLQDLGAEILPNWPIAEKRKNSTI